MDIRTQLSAFLRDKDSVVREAAEGVAILTQMVANNELTADEYNELVDDLCDIKKISSINSKIKTKTEIVDALQKIQLIAKVFS